MVSPRQFSALIAATLVGVGVSLDGLAADAPPARGIAASPVLKPAGPGSVPAGPEGFFTRWLVLDPIPGDGRVTDSAVQAAAKKEYFADQYSVMAHDGDKITIGDASYTWHAVDSSKHNLNLYHFAFFQGKPTSNQVFWAMTIVNSPEEVSGVRLAVGSNAGSVWWLNGQEVVGIYGDRQTFIDDGVSRKLTLRKGPNVVRVMVVNNGGMVDCCARFLDRDDQPLTRLTFSLEAPTR